MNNIVENMIEFLNGIEAPTYFREDILIKHLKLLTKQIYDSGKNRKYTIKIGEKILNFIKNYDDNLGKFNVSDNGNSDYYNKNTEDNDSGNDDDEDPFSNDKKKFKIDDIQYSEDEKEDEDYE